MKILHNKKQISHPAIKNNPNTRVYKLTALNNKKSMPGDRVYISQNILAVCCVHSNVEKMNKSVTLSIPARHPIISGAQKHSIHLFSA